jgi:hypothetical protein
MSILFIALALAPLENAPAPPPRPRPPRPLTLTSGAYDLAWDGGRHPVQLGQGGNWWCHFAGNDWVGTYTWNAKTRTLDVWEWPLTDPDARIHWQAVLDGKLAGKAGLDCSAVVRFTLPKR